MPRKKKVKKNNNKNLALHTLSFAVIWSLAIILFVIAAFNFGISQASGKKQVKNISRMPENLASQENKKEDQFRATVSKVEAYIRSNMVAMAKANDAGDDKAVADDICFINTNRAIIFYRSNDKDRYLAEVVFGEDNGQVKIDRFILKIKNDTDYSGGVYGAD